jgi:hypothetical protein
VPTGSRARLQSAAVAFRTSAAATGRFRQPPDQR